MADTKLARRVENVLYFDGVNISASAKYYLLSMTYTDNEADKTDDLQLTFDDREKEWMQWLKESGTANVAGQDF